MTANPIYSEQYKVLRRRLKLARIEAGFDTQHEAGEAMGTSQKFISLCENGQRKIDVFELLEFAEIYRKPITYFYDGLSVPRRQGSD